MTAYLDFEDKSVEKAVKKASQKLSISESKLKYEVVSYGSSGIFGLAGARRAKIRVFLPEEEKKKPEPVETGVSDAGAEVDTYKMQAREEIRSLIEETFEEHDDSKSLAGAIEVGKSVLQRIVDAITSDANVTVEKRDEQTKTVA